ncbi:hypothetical protein WN51_12354 [Melipona quadrifasciata]|uniref:Uncharacterized protein n=1 Tax=Melipona quadrifasciata TaxID=166423 RepID=A0A0N0U660_9HYME|nr:hypothetical protein WN51_12354 [Melipona quadrifasciata]
MSHVVQTLFEVTAKYERYLVQQESVRSGTSAILHLKISYKLAKVHGSLILLVVMFNCTLKKEGVYQKILKLQLKYFVHMLNIPSTIQVGSVRSEVFKTRIWYSVYLELNFTIVSTSTVYRLFINGSNGYAEHYEGNACNFNLNMPLAPLLKQHTPSLEWTTCTKKVVKDVWKDDEWKGFQIKAGIVKLVYFFYFHISDGNFKTNKGSCSVRKTWLADLEILELGNVKVSKSGNLEICGYELILHYH